MRFPHAHSGVKKIFAGVLIETIASLLVIVSAVLLALPAAKEANSALPGVAAGILIATGIAALVAFIFEIIGLFQAKQDEPSFGIALFITFLAIVLTVVKIIFDFIPQQPWTPNMSNALDAVVDTCSLVVTLLIITGIVSLAEQLGEEGYAARGRIVRNIFLIIFLIGLILDIISKFVRFNETAALVMGYISIGASVVNFIAFVWYLVYLAKAPKKLSK